MLLEKWIYGEINVSKDWSNQVVSQRIIIEPKSDFVVTA